MCVYIILFLNVAYNPSHAMCRCRLRTDTSAMAYCMCQSADVTCYVRQRPVQSPPISVVDKTSKQILAYYQPSLMNQFSLRVAIGNNLVKVTAVWNQLETTSVTDNVHDVVPVQYSDVRCALISRGKFYLAATFVTSSQLQHVGG